MLALTAEKLHATFVTQMISEDLLTTILAALEAVVVDTLAEVLQGATIGIQRRNMSGGQQIRNRTDKPVGGARDNPGR